MSKNRRRFENTIRKIDQILDDFNLEKIIDEIELKQLFDKLFKYKSREKIDVVYFGEEIDRVLQIYSDKSKYIIEECAKNIPVEYYKNIFENKKHLAQNGLFATLLESGSYGKYFENIKDEYSIKSMKERIINNRSNKSRKIIIHTGPTNSGKTYNAKISLKNADRGIYLSPLRLLAKEIYEDLNMSGVPCDLQTGDEDIQIPFSKHISMTIEKLPLDREYDVAIIDEAQLMSDFDRGGSWTRAILGVDVKELHICCSENTIELLKNIFENTGESYEIKKYKRATNLIVSKNEINGLEDTKENDAYIAFSKKEVLDIRDELIKLGHKPSVLFGELPAEIRMKEINKYFDGETNVIVATDSIGMGVNIPIRRIIFYKNEKYDGEEKRELTSQEVKQIAGRAGRRNMFDKGYVSYIDQKMSNDIKNKVKEKDLDISEAYIFPDESLFKNINFIPLKDRLEMWEYSDYYDNGIKKKVPDQYYVLLSEIEGKIPKKYFIESIDLKKFLDIPFDYEKEPLKILWKELVISFFNNKYIFDIENVNIAYDIESLMRTVGDDQTDLLLLSFYYEKVCLMQKFSELHNDKNDQFYEGLKEQLVKGIEELLFLPN